MIKKIIIGVLILVAVVVLGFIAMTMYTKSHSPQDTVAFEGENGQIEVTYSRPYKKGRVIFPDLVPYDQVWRTGANEATSFSTSQDLTIYDQTLPKGTYSLWTIPSQSEWEIIFNKEIGQWGVSMDGVANRNPDLDVLSIAVPVYHTENDIEQFTIQFEESDAEVEMLMMWENTIVVVPISK